MQDSQQVSDVKVMLVRGAAGKGIESIEKTHTAGLVDTYTITYTDGTRWNYEVENGNGITSIAKTGTSGALTDVYTITFDDGTTETFNVTNGNGITSIEKTGTSGNVDTYTITMTDSTTYTFTVTNAEQAGHTIKDNGTSMTDRAAMNFTDFDMADDSANDETDIKPHRLTSSELSDICLPLPDDPTLVGNVRMSLLWTNPNPSASFAAQTVQVAECDMYLIFGETGFAILKKEGNMYVSLETAGSQAGARYTWHRMIKYQQGIYFYDCERINLADGTVSTANGSLIPKYIYGIKLV